MHVGGAGKGATTVRSPEVWRRTIGYWQNTARWFVHPRTLHVGTVGADSSRGMMDGFGMP